MSIGEKAMPPLEISDSMVTVPYRPRGVTATEHVLKILFFLECVHTGPVAVVWIGH
jgi:hypothetical protein